MTPDTYLGARHRPVFPRFFKSRSNRSRQVQLKLPVQAADAMKHTSSAPSLAVGARSRAASISEVCVIHAHSPARSISGFVVIIVSDSTFLSVLGHLRSHTEERPYVCEWPGCNKGFARQHDCKCVNALVYLSLIA